MTNVLFFVLSILVPKGFGFVSLASKNKVQDPWLPKNYKKKNKEREEGKKNSINNI